MFKAISLYRTVARSAKTCEKVLNRTLLTESFACTEAWNKRSESPILQKVKLDDFYYELENKFQQTGKASAIDVDILANSVKDDSHLDEIEDIVHKFRLSSEATNILPSTHHAFIRAFLSFGDQEELIRILNDRLNYGIFPDDFCSMLMMDKFVKAENFKDAAKIAVLHMLQEDFSNPVIHYMSLYSCHKYLLSPTEWEKVEPANSVDEDEEEVRVRVKYIRNPYFDNHFDLKNPDELIGKTLIMCGDLIKDTVGNTYQAIGYSLFKNWECAKTHFETLLKEKQMLYKDGIEIVKEQLSKALKNTEEVNEKTQKVVKEVESLLEKINSAGLVDPRDVLSVTEQRLKSCISENEVKFITNQKQIYEEWESQRESLLRKEIEEINRKKRLEEIQKKKEELTKREEELFFFEKEDDLDLKIENKKVRYPRKWLGKKKKKHVQGAEYVPPEITKQLG